METRGVMKIIAQRDFRAAGFPVLASVDVNVDSRPVAEVAADLAAIEGVDNISVFLGDPAIILLAMAASLAELNALVMDKICSVDGIRSVETMVCAEVIKYESEFARFARAGSA